MNKKGFTLVELLAVIVVLVIVLLIAILKIKDSINKSADKSISANAGVFIKATNDAASNVNITSPTVFQSGYLTVSELYNNGVNISGTKPDDGFVIMNNFEVSEACLTYNGFKVTFHDGKLDDPVKGECEVASSNQEYACTGETETFSITRAGRYKLEVWGAQGGGSQIDGNTALGVGGKGGYASGIVTLKAGDTLYVNVGCEGKRSHTGLAAGGFNGGGSSFSTNSGDPAGGGGGASDIRINSNSLYARVIVAGGGGGGGEDSEVGGVGGGTVGGGNNAGTQTGAYSGGVFGIGASTSCDGGAGGGGWYGGGAAGGSQNIPTSDNSCDNNGGQGGSGFIFTASAILPDEYSSNHYLLDRNYFLESAQLLSGSQVIPSKTGGEDVTGNERDGYAKITFIN